MSPFKLPVRLTGDGYYIVEAGESMTTPPLTVACSPSPHVWTRKQANYIVNVINLHDDMLAALRAILFQLNQGKILERDACVAEARRVVAKAGSFQENIPND